jgi:ATP-dependent helicase HepA
MWKVGDRLLHRHNRALGLGQIVEIGKRHLVVAFPQAEERLTLAHDSSAIQKLGLDEGGRARYEPTGEEVEIATIVDDQATLKDGRAVSLLDLWPLPRAETLVDRLARGKIDPWEDFRNRMDALRLLDLRRAHGLGAFLGGRIRLFPHQLYVAERATRALTEGRPVRWLLADEVGLGKTVEACLILSRLVHGGLAERALVVAPATLTVQWLGELWRKHHTVFTLLDEQRLKDVRRDFGPEMNPFELHRRAIVSLEALAEDPSLARQAAAAGVDLLVVDEAHHLRRAPGHAGNPAYRAVATIAAAGRHVLLLTATPLEDDAHGFFRLVQLLQPSELPEDSFDGRLADRRPLPACTSATRRIDIGGLPPRVGLPIELETAAWKPFDDLIERLRHLPGDDPLKRRRKSDLVCRALASVPALEALTRALPQPPEGLLELARLDPRLHYLLEQAPGWRRAREKTLIFVAHRETLEWLKTELGRRVQVGIFHEELSPERRDIEVAQFRMADGPALLISTESGGEGRNFEFCRRLVLFDLPFHPALVEQRIGRLDRIGRDRPTEVVFFRPPHGFGRTLADLYVEIGVFAEPLGGLVREMRHVANEIERVALDPATTSTEGMGSFAQVLEESRSARERIHEAAYHELHREPYDAALAPAILARVPAELDALCEDIVVRAASRFGFEVEAQSGRRVWQIGFGGEALIDHLPGVAAGTIFRGTFDREEAVADESLGFFASGHALVEGILHELEEGERGQIVLLQVPGAVEDFGLLAVLRAVPGFEVIFVDGRGRLRPEIVELLEARRFSSETIDAQRWLGQASWSPSIRKLAKSLPEGREVVAVAAVRIRRQDPA